MQPQILNCMKNFLIGLFALIGTTGISAQTQSITVHSQTTGKEEVIDIPESMQSEMDSLFLGLAVKELHQYGREL